MVCKASVMLSVLRIQSAIEGCCEGAQVLHIELEEVLVVVVECGEYVVIGSTTRVAIYTPPSTSR